MNQEKISDEDLAIVKDAQKTLQSARVSLKNLELDCENKILRLYLKHGLRESDSIEIETGKINRSSSTTV